MSKITPLIAPYPVGIDLGTTNSSAAVFRNGEAVPIPLAGNRTIPSVVSFKKEGKVLVGEQAKRRVILDPENTVYSVKRHRGEKDWQKEFLGQKFTPTDIETKILAEVKARVEEQTNCPIEGTLRFAVIGVPANSADAQRKSVIESAEAAGLKILRLLEEPVATAIAYGFEKKVRQDILAYDLGGGTFDACIVRVDTTKDTEPVYTVLAKEGIPVLGGDDFDAELMKVANACFKETCGIDLLDGGKEQGISEKKLRGARQLLKEAAERAKIELSEADAATMDIASIVKDGQGKEHHLHLEITRTQFEDLIRPLVDKTIECTLEALKSAGLSPAEVHRVIVAGGSSRIPLVRTLLQKATGKEPYCDADPDLSVARGDAVFAAGLDLPDAIQKPPQAQGPRVAENNIVSHNLGIEVLGERFSTIIAKGSAVPLEDTRPFYTSVDGQEVVRITLFQFPKEGVFVTEEGGSRLGEFRLLGITPAKAGERQVDVTLKITANNTVELSAKCVNNEKGVPEKKLTITLDGSPVTQEE